MKKKNLQEIYLPYILESTSKNNYSDPILLRQLVSEPLGIFSIHWSQLVPTKEEFSHLNMFWQLDDHTKKYRLQT